MNTILTIGYEGAVIDDFIATLELVEVEVLIDIRDIPVSRKRGFSKNALADALSSARPGARREMLETYIKRVEDLENISYSFDGVERAYAIQAGREIRVMVKSDEVTDEVASVLSRDIAKKIEEELSYPGQVKVTVIRETRSVGVAK